MRSAKIAWIMPNSKLQPPQHKTDRPTALADYLLSVVLLLAAVYFGVGIL